MSWIGISENLCACSLLIESVFRRRLSGKRLGGGGGAPDGDEDGQKTTFNS